MAKVSLEQLALTDAHLCVYQGVCGGRNAEMPNGRAEMVIKIFEKLTHTQNPHPDGGRTLSVLRGKIQFNF